MKISLVIMAAGLSTRYGDIKQIQSFGPNNETLLEYSIYDALNAGFSHFVFVIREEIKNKFLNKVVSKIQDPRFSYQLAYQDTASFVPKKFYPLSRVKPWGTGHAVLAAKNLVSNPFGVMNADDFYGACAYQLLAQSLKENTNNFFLIGYPLKQTLSEYGSVSRGICAIDNDYFLESIVEHTSIAKDENGKLISWSSQGKPTQLTGNEIVSLNLWGFQPFFFSYLEKFFEEFLENYAQSDKAEFFLPSAVHKSVNNHSAKVSVNISNEKWHGITYPADYPLLKAHINEQILKGAYPEKLWH